MKLDGTVALVTGAAKRVGRATALELARGGCDLVVHYRSSRAEAEGVAEQIRGMGRRTECVAADLGDSDAWGGLVNTVEGLFGRLDILVNNASAFLVAGEDTLESFEVGLWERMLRVNLLAPVGLSRHAAALLRKSGRGRIVNLLDASTSRPWASHLAYSASKGALETVTRALARELAPEITVNGVAPGIAEFPDSYDQATRDRLVGKVPMQRAGTPEEVASAVRFLAEGGGYITGEVIRVDGGRNLA